MRQTIEFVAYNASLLHICNAQQVAHVPARRIHPLTTPSFLPSAAGPISVRVATVGRKRGTHNWHSVTVSGTALQEEGDQNRGQGKAAASNSNQWKHQAEPTSHVQEYAPVPCSRFPAGAASPRRGRGRDRAGLHAPHARGAAGTHDTTAS